MNFIDRVSLGDKLVERVMRYRDKGAVIICLQESSLLTCLTVASQIRAWVYPLAYEPMYAPGHTHTLLGAFDQEGEFCPDQGNDGKEIELTSKMKATIKKQRTAAMKSIKAQAESYGMKPDKRQLSGRDILLLGDVVTSTLPILVVRQLLKDVSPKSLTAVIGNTTPEVAQLVRVSTGEAEILDVMSGVVYDHDHYFEHTDTYTVEQKHTLTRNIAAYWQ